MKTIMCFGDSNTWGYNGFRGERYRYFERWTGILDQLLGDEYRIYEEGLNGRTTAFDDPYEPYRNGRHYLPIALSTHKPIDLVIIMLGTNDLKSFFGKDGYAIAKGLYTLGEMVQVSEAGPSGKGPKVLLISPSYIYFPEDLEKAVWGDANKKIKAMEKYLEKMVVATEMNFMKASTCITLNEGDGIHLTEKDHKALAKGIYQYLQKNKKVCL